MGGDPVPVERRSGGPPWVAVVGAGLPDPETDAAAEAVGRHVAERGAVLVCGGMGGVMAAACRGAREAGGTTVGLLPGTNRDDANRWVSVPVVTGLGELRNGLLVRNADAVIAVGGEFGTLSEIALALKIGRPVVALASWDLRRPGGRNVPELEIAGDPADAVERALRRAAR